MTISAHSATEPPPSELMERMLAGHFVAQCIHVVAVLGIADLLAEGHKTIEEIASTTRCPELSLQRLLRTLASLGVFTENMPGRFHLTPLGATLRSDSPASLRDKAIFEISAPIWSAWGSLLDSLHSDQPSFSQLHNATLYQYLSEHAELGTVFNRFMTAQSNLHNAAIADAYDFSKVGTLIDVGGGHGATLTAVLQRYPGMKGVLFDLPEVVATARLEASDIAVRCELRAGNMLQSVPTGGDVYLIKRVMMDKSDADAVTVLQNCVAAMNKAGRILVIDPMLPASTEAHPNWVTDMLAMVITGGRCRTEPEFRSILNSAGIILERVVPTRSPNFILEGVGRDR